MSGLFVFIDATPADNTIVGRQLHLSGSVSGAGSGSLMGIWVQFGAGGPVVQVHGIARKQATVPWSWDGLVPNNIRPGQPFPIIVTSSGAIMIKGGPEPEFQDVDGQAVRNVVLENIVPQVKVTDFQSPLVVQDVPYNVTLDATVTEQNPDLYKPTMQYRIGDGPATPAPFPNGSWQPSLSFDAGDHPIAIQAADGFGSVASFQKTLSIIRYAGSPAVDPLPSKTLRGVPTTSSITTWTRLEPQVTNADMNAATSARLFDPLWLMARQWQMGEFQAEDAGTPVKARVRATNALLSRCHFGELSASTTAPAYDPNAAPLEALVERRRTRPADANDSRMLTLAVDAGLHFLHMVDLNATAKKYRSAFLSRYALQAPAAPTPGGDDASSRFIQTMVGRAPDARLLAAAFRTGGGAIVFDPQLHVTTTDAPAVQQVATAWLAWYDALFAEPAAPADDAWTPSRLEYAVSVSARLSAQAQDALTLSASEFDGGRLDWSSFDVNGDLSLDTSGDKAFSSIVETTLPAPVSIHGTPAPRFWELEDAKIAYGLLPAGPTDLAHLLMIEYASSYGNDWFVVPLNIPVGSLTRVDSLVVTDSFGVQSLLRPLGDPALPPPSFSLWQQSVLRKPGTAGGNKVANLFFLPPTIGRSLDSGPLEDVLFTRDEMANLAWGIERTIEGALEKPVSLASASAMAALAAPPVQTGAPPRYLLSTGVPDNWIPLLPVQRVENGIRMQRLKRGAIRAPDGSARLQHARSEALNAAADLLLYDEEIPREGTHVTRRRRMARWIDGSTWVWTAFRNEVGLGEGSAALGFDQLVGDGQG